MPIYEYECLKCGKHFSMRRGFDDRDEDVKCPKCETNKPRRKISNIASISPGCGDEGSSNHFRNRG